MTGAEGALEIYANNSSPFDAERALDLRKQAQGRRTVRHYLRAVCWRCSSLERVRACGRVPLGQGVTVRLRDGFAGIGGVSTCGSVWVCSVCSAKILARRAFEIGAVLGMAQGEGHSLVFGTLTMRHRRGQSLDQLWRAAGKAWGRATAGKAWTKAKGRHGVIGWVRVWEVTHGRNGWHVHVHFVLVLDESKAAGFDELCSGMFNRWSRGLESAGLAAPLRKAQDWHLVSRDGGGEIAQYLAKITDTGIAGPDALGLELTHSMPGRSRSGLGTRPVWSLLDEVEDDGDITLWREWEKGSLGKRQVGWSQGLREQFGLLDERSDEEIAKEEIGTADDDLVLFESAAWKVLVREPLRIPQLLDAAENGGLRGLRGLLDKWGDVPYVILVDEDRSNVE